MRCKAAVTKIILVRSSKPKKTYCFNPAMMLTHQKVVTREGWVGKATVIKIILVRSSKLFKNLPLQYSLSESSKFSTRHPC